MSKTASRVLALLCLFALGCSGTQKAPAVQVSPTAASGSSAPRACGEYAQRLCIELGPRTDACRSVLGVVALLSPRACEAGLADFAMTRARIAELRKACEAVAKNICAELGAESEGCRAIRQNLPEIPPGHCAALLRDQQQLIAALRQRQALSAELSDERWQALLAGQPAAFGAANAAVTVVEFSDFQCPYCAQAADTVKRLKQEYGSRIRFVFRHFPLPFHPDARAAAQAALAAQQQGKFWEYHDLLFGNQTALGADALLAYARRLGLDLDVFRSVAQGQSTSELVADDIRLGESVQVQGTPTMFVDKRRVEDPLDYGAVSRVVERALSQTH
jgi:protein-disulfide isomerase